MADPARLRGCLWEVLILRLLEQNGFDQIRTGEPPRIRILRPHFLEMQGRGTWHQIDCPCTLRRFIPFVYPIRLLGEVKFLKNPVRKEVVREFIGVLKDIQENHFVADSSYVREDRYTELGVIFSASGFQAEAEKLAFAHGISTVSHHKVRLLEPLKDSLLELSKNHFRHSNMRDDGSYSRLTELFEQFLQGDNSAASRIGLEFRPRSGFEDLLLHMREGIFSIRSSFVATTSGGLLMHFVGDREFPDRIFSETDTRKCRVYFYTAGGSRYFYLAFPENDEQGRFYFSPPSSLEDAAFHGQPELANEKRRVFKTLSIARSIHGLLRNLVLELDTDWLDAEEKAPDDSPPEQWLHLN
jgi:hypothetical protein